MCLNFRQYNLRHSTGSVYFAGKSSRHFLRLNSNFTERPPVIERVTKLSQHVVAAGKKLVELKKLSRNCFVTAARERPSQIGVLLIRFPSLGRNSIQLPERRAVMGAIVHGTVLVMAYSICRRLAISASLVVVPMAQ